MLESVETSSLLTVPTEPEFRLPLALSYVIFSAVGFFVWGQSVYAAEPWAVPVIVGLGLINLGVQLTTTAIAAYLVDAHRQVSGEAFALLGFVTKVFCMGLTFYITDWLVTSGIRNAFFTLGGITAALGLSSIPCTHGANEFEVGSIVTSSDSTIDGIPRLSTHGIGSLF